jgi:hypothetical protein
LYGNQNLFVSFVHFLLLLCSYEQGAIVAALMIGDFVLEETDESIDVDDGPTANEACPAALNMNMRKTLFKVASFVLGCLTAVVEQTFSIVDCVKSKL